MGKALVITWLLLLVYYTLAENLKPTEETATTETVNLTVEPEGNFTESGNNTSENNSTIVMPTPPTFDCQAHFPGTLLWTLCLQEFHQKIAIYQQAMEEYRRKVLAASQQSMESDPNSSTSSFINGYQMEARGLSIWSSLANGQMTIETRVGNPQKLERFNDEKKRESHWNMLYVLNGRNVTRWIRITPPEGVLLSNLVDKVEDGTLKIVGPDVGSGSGSSFSSTSSFSGIGSSSVPLFAFPVNIFGPGFPFNRQ